MEYNITAATGHLGEKITEELLKLVPKKDAAITVRNPDKAKQLFGDDINIKKADYNSEEEMTSAFTGTDVLIYIPSFTFPSHVRILEFEKAVNAAEKANVKQFIFVGFMADHENSPFKMSPFFGYVPRRLASSELKYTLTRNAMYADPLPPYLPELVEKGSLPYPAGDGKINFVSRQDIAKAVAQIAIRPELHGEKYTLTGDKDYSMEELASILSDISGETISYSPISNQEFAETYDEPKGFGPTLTSLYSAASRHLMDETTNDIEFITGEPPENLKHFIKRNYKM
ncbi:SDR family oxidoreductase [Halobacillus litoralis]|uniref:SDR family oxidoreductase n=1 Tax=Halobacillus litoralis TaxID=45668 RepID=UPI001CFD112B|nr:SDR family oxidoreductase [Halobacillus litoralis]WLR46635.1 SDR family oxidoreductase [Halobacillus litoralis]